MFVLAQFSTDRKRYRYNRQSLTRVFRIELLANEFRFVTSRMNSLRYAYSEVRLASPGKSGWFFGYMFNLRLYFRVSNPDHLR